MVTGFIKGRANYSAMSNYIQASLLLSDHRAAEFPVCCILVIHDRMPLEL